MTTITIRPPAPADVPAVDMIKPLEASTAFAAVQRVLEFVANVLLAALDAIVARAGTRFYDLDGHRLGRPVGRHAPLEGVEPVADDWSPLDMYDRAAIEDSVRTLVLAGAAA